MKYKNMVLSSLFSLASMTSFAGKDGEMGITHKVIKVPSQEILIARFKENKLSAHLPLTAIAKEFGNQEKSPNDIAFAVVGYLSSSDQKYLRPVVNAILQEHPLALIELGLWQSRE
jgi:Asp-tRNA(Asn)/Glu-tRNA(Gln) amidotransferase B subunit